MKWLVVGLGNPGETYEHTRHNIGFMVADNLVREAGSVWRLSHKFQSEIAENGTALWLKPQTFMNLSGTAVAAVVNFYKIPPEHVVVIHDDLDIAWGTVKSGLDKGPKVHHGLQSVEHSLGTPQFWRVRMGIEARTPAERAELPGDKYVLLPFTKEQQIVLPPFIHRGSERVKEIAANAF